MTTSRRGFLGMLMGAVAAAAIGIRLAPETPEFAEAAKVYYDKEFLSKLKTSFEKMSIAQPLPESGAYYVGFIHPFFAAALLTANDPAATSIVDLLKVA